LARILEAVTPVDFKQLANIPQEGVVSSNEYRVLTVRVLLQLAQEKNLGLARVNEMTYAYNGSFWTMLMQNDMKSFLGAVAAKMGVLDILAHDYQFRDTLFKQFESAAHLKRVEPDKNKTLINLQNGTFEFTSDGFILRDFRADDFMTYQLPFASDQEAKAPQFMKFLNEVLPDKESQQLLAEFIAYTFTNHLKLEKILILKGSGANGKSVIFEIITALLGRENCSTYSMHSLTNPTNGYARAMLQNKLVNYTSEISGNIDVATFKQLVSGEAVEARLPYGNFFTVTRIPKFISNVNELPKNVEHNNAFFRRFIIIPFNQGIEPEKQDKELANKIVINELGGVFNWILEGLNRLMKQKGFSACKASEMMVNQYNIESDTVAVFMKEKGYRRSATKHIMRPLLYGEYREFCSTDGYKAVSNQNFGKGLEHAKYQLEVTNKGWRIYAEKITLELPASTTA